MPRKTLTARKQIDIHQAEPTVGKYIDFPDVSPSLPYKPSKPYFVEALAKGHTVGIHHVKEYPTFFKLFDRYKTAHKLNLQITIRQVREDLWLLIPRKPSDPKPGSKLNGDFREHGRYIWLSSQLNGGEVVEADSDLEAKKIRRAWMLYTSREDRTDRECIIEMNGKRYRVSLLKS